MRNDLTKNMHLLDENLRSPMHLSGLRCHYSIHQLPRLIVRYYLKFAGLLAQRHVRSSVTSFLITKCSVIKSYCGSASVALPPCCLPIPHLCLPGASSVPSRPFTRALKPSQTCVCLLHGPHIHETLRTSTDTHRKSMKLTEHL